MAPLSSVSALAALALASAGAAQQPARTTVNFDLAWRFSRGFEPRSAQCTYEQNANYG